MGKCIVYFNPAGSHLMDMIANKLVQLDAKNSDTLQVSNEISEAQIAVVTPNQIKYIEEVCNADNIPMIILSDNEMLLREYSAAIDVSPPPTSVADIQILYYRILSAYRLVFGS